MDKLEFKKDISEMEGAEARATLMDTRSKYNDAREDYKDARDTLKDFKDKFEDVEDEAETAREFYAEFAAEASGLSEDTILDKFDDAGEIKDEFLSDAEFKLVTEENGEDEEDENKFDDNPEESDNLPGETESDFSERASNVISQMTVDHE